MSDLPQPERHDYELPLPDDPKNLKAYGETLQDKSMEALRHELAVTGGVRHAFWVMTKDSLYGFFPEYRTRKEKTGVIGELRTFAHEMGAWGTIWAADTWMVAPQESGEEPPEPPSQHPDRVDALMVLLTFPSGESRLLQQPYWKQNGSPMWGSLYEQCEGITGPGGEQPPMN